MNNLKRVLIAGIAIFMILASFGVPAIATTTEVVYLNANVHELNVGQTATISIGFEGFDPADIIGVEVHLSFNQDELEVVNINRPFAHSTWYSNNSSILTENQNELRGSTARFAFSLSPHQRLSSIGTVASIQVRAKKAGQASISIGESLITYHSLDGRNKAHEKQGITLTINNEDGSPGPGNPGNGGGNGGNGGGSGGTGGGNNGGSSDQNGNQQPEHQFNDQAAIDRLTWAKDAIYELMKLGIMQGDDKNNFRPNATMTREEFAKVMDAVIHLDQPLKGIDNLSKKDVTIAYADISPTRWSYQNIYNVTEYGLMQGVEVGEVVYFEPTKGISRAELATVFYRFLTQLHPELEIHQKHSFTDVADGHWAGDAVSLMQQEGIVSGKSATSFAPRDLATRAEVAVLIYRILQFEPGLR